jgi:hypothetical protein
LQVDLKRSYCFFLYYVQAQVEREKLAYDFENMQTQLDKSQGQAGRLVKEKEAAQLEADRFRDKSEKAQVCLNGIYNESESK